MKNWNRSKWISVAVACVMGLWGCQDEVTGPDLRSTLPLEGVGVSTFVSVARAQRGDTISVEYVLDLPEEDDLASFEATLSWVQDNFEYLGGAAGTSEEILEQDLVAGWARIRVLDPAQLETRSLLRFYLAVEDAATDGFEIADVIVSTSDAEDGAEWH